MTDQVITQWTADTILDFLYQHREVLRAMGVIKIGLFGSYVRGDQQADSDIDVLLEMNSPSYRDFMNVWNFLEDNLGRKVDIGEEHLLKEIARPYILGEVRYVEGF